MAGRAEWCQLLQAALSLLSLRGRRHGNTEGLGRGSFEPRSPRQAPCQGHNTEDEETRALPQRAVLTRLAGARPTSSTRLSAQAMGPWQAAHPTPAGTALSQPSPAARALSLELSQEE